MANELILIVEDNEKNRRLLRKVLQVSGYRVAEVETGRDAVVAAREQEPDLILLDYQLPDIDGIEVFRLIRADPIRYSDSIFYCLWLWLHADIPIFVC